MALRPHTLIVSCENTHVSRIVCKKQNGRGGNKVKKSYLQAGVMNFG